MSDENSAFSMPKECFRFSCNSEILLYKRIIYINLFERGKNLTGTFEIGCECGILKVLKSNSMHDPKISNDVGNI